jgi:hypothetical protein
LVDSIPPDGYDERTADDSASFHSRFFRFILKGVYMKPQSRLVFFTLITMLVMLVNLALPVPALADDSAPPDPLQRSTGGGSTAS